MAKEKSNRDKIIEDMRNLLGDGMVVVFFLKNQDV